MLILGLVWGGTVVAQRFAVAEVEPIPLVTLRLLTAVAFFLPFLPRVGRGLRRRPRTWFDPSLIGTLNPAVAGIISGWALQYASSGVVAVLISTAPLLTAVLGRLLFQEEALRRMQVAGLAAALGGTVLLVTTRSSGLESAEGDLRGHLGALLIALILSTSTLYSRRRLVGVDSLAAAGGQMSAGLVVSTALTVLFGPAPTWDAISIPGWLAIAFSGAIGLSAAFWLFLGMIHRHGSTASLLALNVMPVAAASMGALLLGESLTIPTVAGASLVLVGVFLFAWG